MKRNLIPNQVQSKLDTFERQVAHWAAQVSKAQEAIANARDRLSGGFEGDHEYNDLRATLDRLVEKDLPNAEAKLDDARYLLDDCKAFLAELPDDVTLELVKAVKPNGVDLHTVRRRIADAEEEIARLTAIPVPSSDIEGRIEQYVAALARPKVTGVATGQRLQVTWPTDVIAVLALLLPNEMTKALMAEVERQANEHGALTERKKRIAELKAEVDTLQRQAFALGDTSALPPRSFSVCEWFGVSQRGA